MKKVEFENGVVLEVGAEYEEGHIIELNIVDGLIEVICVGGGEGWGVYYDQFGVIEEVK